VAEVTKAAASHRDRLGFRVVGYFFECPPLFAMVGRGEQIVMLSRMQSGRRGGSDRALKGEAIDAYLGTDNADDLYASFGAAGVERSSCRQRCASTA